MTTNIFYIIINIFNSKSDRRITIEMKKIQDFYQTALREGKFSQEFLEELQTISKEDQLKKFIDEKLQPMARQMGYDISTDEFLNYEKTAAREIDEQELENISGGINVKNLVLGGFVSLMALGAGSLAAGSFAHAEINTQQIAESANIMEQVIEEEKIKEEVGGQNVGKEEQESMGKNSDQTDLETAQSAARVDQNEFIKTKNLTEGQKLYALEALNMQDAYALLQSKVIENLRFFGNISEISLNAKGDRQYSADKGDAFAEVLFMLFPSPAGRLSTSCRGSRLNLSKYGDISPETMARFCAILNDYRNGEIIRGGTGNGKVLFPSKSSKKNINLQDGKVTGLVAEFFKKYGFKNAELYEETENPKTKKTNVSFKKISLYHDFLDNLIDSIDLEDAKDSPYPKYLTERILMAYMIKTLNNEQEINRFYSTLVQALSQNESNKKIVAKESKSEEIKAENAKLRRLSEIIGAAKFQTLSPYKNKTFEDNSIFGISPPDSNGEVSFNYNFSDCSDTTVRHVINLLVYSNEGNWDLLLQNANIDDLNMKLKNVIHAINSQEKVKFYSLKDRLQMFFLYQKDHGADDDSIIARTLWGYADCNMAQKSDKIYDILYHNENRYELVGGYINMLKIMYNIAYTLNLGQEEDLPLAKNAIDILSDTVRGNRYDESAFKVAMENTFGLFHPDNKLTFDLSSCKIDENEIIDNVTVTVNDIIQFTISQTMGHSFVSHNPIKFTPDAKFFTAEYTSDDFAKLLLKSFGHGNEDEHANVHDVMGFYGVFSGEDYYSDDPFMQTNLFKKYNTLDMINYMQKIVKMDGFEGSYSDIKYVVDELTEMGLRDIDQIKIDKDANLLDYLYAKYFSKLNSNDISKFLNEYYKLRFENAGNAKVLDEQNLALKYVSVGKNKVYLLIGNYQGNELVIPSTISDSSGKKSEVVGFKIFEDLNELEKITFQGEFEDLKIERGSIEHTKNLEEVEILGKVKNVTIRKNTFKEHKKLHYFEINEKVDNFNIEDSAFERCKTLTRFSFYENVNNLILGNKAFSNCEELLSFRIPDGTSMLYIGDEAFSNCTLETFTIPESVSTLEMGDGIFKGCGSSMEFNVPNHLLDFVPYDVFEDVYVPQLS